MSSQTNTITANINKRYHADGRYEVWLDVSLIHGHQAGGDYRAVLPTAFAVVDDYGTLVFVTPWM